MTELEELREELDDLRSRVSTLETDRELNRSIVSKASLAAKSADREVARSRSEWREVVKDLEAGMGQIVSLLTSPAACLPARRPENTQSASDNPLT